MQLMHGFESTVLKSESEFKFESSSVQAGLESKSWTPILYEGSSGQTRETEFSQKYHYFTKIMNFLMNSPNHKLGP